MYKKPKVVFIGGIESGKTTTIQSLWENSVTDYKIKSGVYSFDVSEMLVGRSIVDFEVIELPRINYTSSEWIEKPGVIEHLSTADVIVVIVTCDDALINVRRKYIENIFSSIKLKKDVVITIGYGMADWILTPVVARNLEISKSKQVSLNSITNLMLKRNMVYSEFIGLNKFDTTFAMDSVVPYSNNLEWNIDILKYQIWNGIVLSINNEIYDESLPTIVLSGKTGCGKTSTINALWNLDLATGRVVSCTKFPAVMRITDNYNGESITFNLVDLPGIAESMDANSAYRKFYYNFISKANVLICLSQADRRAYKQDQMFYSELISNGVLTPSQNVILGINQADLLFKDNDNPDGIDLHTLDTSNNLINEKSVDYFKCIADVFNGFDNITSESVAIYSVLQNWNLDSLKEKIYKLF